MSPPKNDVLYGLSLLVVLSLFFTSNVVLYTLDVWSHHTPARFTYNVGDASPGRTLIIPDDSPVQILIQDTIRYNYSNPEAAKEASKNFPRGSGSFRAPGDHRAMFVSMYHQLHCVETMGKELIATDPSHWGHVQHCINFLREMAMCRPDLTLELGDFTKRDFTLERTGATHVCRDWQQIFEVVDQDWLKWLDYWHSHPELNEPKHKEGHEHKHMSTHS